MMNHPLLQGTNSALGISSGLRCPCYLKAQIHWRDYHDGIDALADQLGGD
jgi:hypothetical protein